VRGVGLPLPRTRVPEHDQIESMYPSISSFFNGV
jgi:hypothetical protein